jgi:polyisoprenoid-binding protein YceI
MKRLPIVVSLGFACALLVGFSVEAADWTQQTGSTLKFRGEQQGEAFEGGFGRFESKISFDPAALETAKFDVSIDITSADTANSERDETMLGADFFDSARFPKAQFSTGTFREIAPGRYEAEATLRIRDKSVALKFPFSWTAAADGAELRAEVELNRLDFDIGTGDWEDADSVGHKVVVMVRLLLKPAA